MARFPVVFLGRLIAVIAKSPLAHSRPEKTRVAQLRLLTRVQDETGGGGGDGGGGDGGGDGETMV